MRERTPGLLPVIAVVVMVALPLTVWWQTSTSVADFADHETFESNHLGAGSIDLEVGTGGAVLLAVDVAPGDEATGLIEISNVGTLPLRYEVSAATSGGPLGQWLLFHLWPVAPSPPATGGPCDARPAGSSLASNLALSSERIVIAPSTRTAPLAPGQATTLCLAATLPLAAPNSVQDDRLDIELVIDAVHDIGSDS